MLRALTVMRSAMAARRRLWGTTRSPPSMSGSAVGSVTGVPPAADRAAARTSRRMIRPDGPDPATRARSTRSCRARRLAEGDAKVRPAVGRVSGDPEDRDFAETETGRGAAERSTAVAAAFAGMVSSASPIQAMASSTLASSPAAQSILSRMPSPSAATSKAAFSDSTTAMTSPLSTRSPSALHHSSRTPVVRFSPTCGIRTGIMRRQLAVRQRRCPLSVECKPVPACGCTGWQGCDRRRSLRAHRGGRRLPPG